VRSVAASGAIARVRQRSVGHDLRSDLQSRRSDAALDASDRVGYTFEPSPAEPVRPGPDGVATLTVFASPHICSKSFHHRIVGPLEQSVADAVRFVIAAHRSDPPWVRSSRGVRISNAVRSRSDKVALRSLGSRVWSVGTRACSDTLFHCSIAVPLRTVRLPPRAAEHLARPAPLHDRIAALTVIIDRHRMWIIARADTRDAPALRHRAQIGPYAGAFISIVRAAPDHRLTFMRREGRLARGVRRKLAMVASGRALSRAHSPADTSYPLTVDRLGGTIVRLEESAKQQEGGGASKHSAVMLRTDPGGRLQGGVLHRLVTAGNDVGSEGPV
jgi:hypothetical protein